MQLSPVSIIPIFPILILVLVTISITSKLMGIIPQKGRYGSIDGLRGYLALFVFLHHSVIWYFYLRYHQWTFPPSQIYSHFGPTSVSLFFMITSFLFFSKLIDAKSGNIDWLKLYVSRFLRILPLYIFAVVALFLIAFSFSYWTLHEPLSNIFIEFLGWFAFMEPDINGMQGTRLIVAGVVWSLAFEWMFYFSLPFFGLLFFNIRASAKAITFAAIFLLLFIAIIYDSYSHNAFNRMSPFFGGMVAAFVARDTRVRSVASSKYVSLLIILLLLVAILFFASVYSFIPYVCIVLVFIAIAGGNTLFGILTHHASCLLGQISYSIYLLHGMLLFITFRFELGFPFSAGLTALEHWLVIGGSSILLIIICTLTYYYIERPFMHLTSKVVHKIRH